MKRLPGGNRVFVLLRRTLAVSFLIYSSQALVFALGSEIGFEMEMDSHSF